MSTFLGNLFEPWRERVRLWRQRYSLTHEFDHLGRNETQRILRDIGLSMDDIAAITKPNAGPTVLLPQRLQEVGVDSRYLNVSDPATYRELQRTCARCVSWRRCARDLARHDAQSGLKDYCLNAAIIDELVARGQRDRTQSRDQEGR